MAHFADVNLDKVTGRVASLVSATTTVMRETTGNTSTEGTDKLTYAVPATGMYRVTVYAKTTEASDAATSHVYNPEVNYNDGGAFTDIDLAPNGDAAGDTLDAKTLNTKGSWTGTFYCVSGTDLVVFMDSVVTGAKTAGVGEYLLVFKIERLD